MVELPTGLSGKAARRAAERRWERRLPTMRLLTGRERSNPLRGMDDGFGRLTPGELPAFLRKIETRRANGVLHLSHDGVASRLYFREGALVFAGSDVGEDLGTRLLKQGKIREAALKEARKQVSEKEEELGALLVRRKWVSAETLRLAQMQQMMSVVDSVLAGDELHYRFADSEASVDREREIPLSVTELVLAAARRTTDTEGILRRLGGEAATVASGATGSEAVGATDEERRVLELISHRASGIRLGELLSGPYSREAVLRGLYALLALGAIRQSNGARVEGQADATEDPEAAPAERRVGPYQILSSLERSPTRNAFRARDTQRNLTVLLELLPSSTDASASILERRRRQFYNNARTIARGLDHPGLVNLLDVGFSQKDEPFLAWEYIEAYSLDTLLEARELNIKETLVVAKQMLEALAHAHAAGFAHTELCPHHIFVAGDLRIKIRGTWLPDGDTRPAESLPRYRVPYIAPEQVNGQRGDEKSDVFSFGAIIYRMMTHRMPFEGSTVPDLVHERLTQDAVPPSVFNRDVTPDMSAFVLRCLERDRTVRFAKASEALTALEREMARRVAGRVPVTVS